MKKTPIFLYFLVTTVFTQEIDNLTIEEKVDLLFQTYQDGLKNTIDRSTELNVLMNPDLVRHAHSDCVFFICNLQNVSTEIIKEKCTAVYAKITSRPNPHLIQRLVYDLEELFPLLESVNVTREDFGDVFVNVLNTRDYEFCSDSWNLRQKYFWQALRPGSFGSTFLKSDPSRGFNISKDERRVITSTFSKLVDNVPIRTINTLLSVVNLQIALDFNTSAVSRASKLKERPYSEWYKTLSYLRLATAFKPNLPIFQEYTDDFPQSVYNCLRLGKEETYLETAWNSGDRENLILRRFLNTIPEDTKYEILTKLMENAKSVPVNEVLFTEIEKLLELYKKRLPGGYKTFFERRIESKDFEEAHERLQRKILWESIVPGPRNGSDLKFSYSVPDDVLTVLVEEVQKLRIVAESNRKAEREMAVKMAEILYNNSHSETARTEKTNEYIQWRKDQRMDPLVCVECYEYNDGLRALLLRSNMKKVPVMQKTFFLTQNRDFRDFGDGMKRRILERALDPRVEMELVDDVVEEEVYNLANV